MRPSRLSHRIHAFPAAVAGPVERVAGAIRGPLVALVAGVAIALAALMGELQGILRGMHLGGAPSVDAGDIAGTAFPPGGPDQVREVLRTWHAFDQATPGFSDSSTILAWFVSLDFVFAAALAALLAIAAARLRGYLARIHDDEAALERAVDARHARKGFDAGEGLEAAGRRAATRASIRELLEMYRGLLQWALVLVPVYLVADWLEGVLMLRVASDVRDTFAAGGTSFWFWPLFFAATVKIAAFALIVLGLAVATVAAYVYGPGQLTWGLHAASIVRAQLAVVVVLAFMLLVDPTEQIADAIRRWMDEPLDGVAAVGFTAVLALVGFASAWHVLGLPDDEREGRERLGAGPWRMTIAFAAAAVLSFVAWLVLRAWDVGFGLLPLAGILGVIALLSAFVSGLEGDPPFRAHAARRVLAPIVAAAPVVALGLAATRASVAETLYAGNPRYVLLLLAGLVLQAAGWSLLLVLRARKDVGGTWTLVLLAFAGALSLGVAIFAWVDPWTLGDAVGAIGVLVAGLTAAGLVLGALTFLSERLEPPKFFVALRLRRLPVITILVVWAFLAATLDTSGRYYDARLVETDEAYDRDRSLQTAFQRWRARGEPAYAGREARPVVFVAASGGGIRAAYWTAAVLDCVVEGRGGCETDPWSGLFPAEGLEERRRGLFAASGVSGGSLGLATYTAHVVADDGDGWVERSLSGDTLAPTIARALFVDLPLSFIRRDGGMDRAETLERAWERAWGEDEDSPLELGLYEVTQGELADENDIPVLVLNGTKVQDGCRFSTAPVDLAVEPRVTEGADATDAGTSTTELDDRLVEDCLALRPFEAASRARYGDAAHRDTWTLGASEDLGDFLCRGEDVRLSTAALLSARFPLVSPSGRIVKCADRELDAPGVNVVDGGYFDTSAASTAVELWAGLADAIASANRADDGPCLVPVLLQIDNGYADVVGTTPSRPLETGVPLQTLATGRDSREAQARQMAALAFTKSFGGIRSVSVEGDDGTRRSVERYAHVYPRAHPGTQAPLGWTLSRTSRADLAKQVASAANRAELERVADWFRPSLRCDEA